jgi:hypothetical protein
VHLKAHQPLRHKVLRILIDNAADQVPIQYLDHDRSPRDDVVLVPAAHVHYAPKQRGVSDCRQSFVFRSVREARELASRRQHHMARLAPALLVQVSGESICEIHICLIASEDPFAYIGQLHTAVLNAAVSAAEFEFYL